VKRKILVADDEKLVRDYFRYFLKKEGYEVYEAENGEFAMELIRNYEIDLVVADYKMPKKNGLELLKELRKGKNFIPVIVISAYGTEELIKEVEKLNGIFIPKPVEFSKLKSLIEELLM